MILKSYKIILVFMPVSMLIQNLRKNIQKYLKIGIKMIWFNFVNLLKKYRFNIKNKNKKYKK